MEFKLESYKTEYVDGDPGKSREGGALLSAWRQELSGYYKEMIEFRFEEPDEIFRKLSAWTARASYMRHKIMASESRSWTAFRTKEIDPFIAECDRQFKNWSRNLSFLAMDWDMQKGQT